MSSEQIIPFVTPTITNAHRSARPVLFATRGRLENSINLLLTQLTAQPTHLRTRTSTAKTLLPGLGNTCPISMPLPFCRTFKSICPRMLNLESVPSLLLYQAIALHLNLGIQDRSKEGKTRMENGYMFSTESLRWMTSIVRNYSNQTVFSVFCFRPPASVESVQ